MKLNEFAKGVHQNAVEHGWWEDQRTFGEIVSLCHSELSEALEEFRAKRPMVYCNPGMKLNKDCMDHGCVGIACWEGKANGSKPEGIAVELADCISAFWTGSARKRWIRMLCWPKRSDT